MNKIVHKIAEELKKTYCEPCKNRFGGEIDGSYCGLRCIECDFAKAIETVKNIEIEDI